MKMYKVSSSFTVLGFTGLQSNFAIFVFFFVSVFLFQLYLGILSSFVSGSQTRKIENDTKIKGTIKYVLFSYCFTGT